MLDKTPIGHIHNVPVYGRLPQRFANTLTKIEAVTSPNEWDEVAYIVSSDEYVELTPDNRNVAGGRYLQTDWLRVKYDDGSKEVFETEMPQRLIYIEAGFFRSEYWFAFTLLHEIGHHNDPAKPTQSSREAEIFAHTYALDRVQNADFHFEDETPPTYYDEAKAIWEGQR